MYGVPLSSFQLVAYTQTSLDVHYPVARERHLYQSAYVLAAPVIDQPRRAFVRAHDAQREQFRPALRRYLLFQLIECESAQYRFRARLDLGDVCVQLTDIELCREVRYLLLDQLVACGDYRRIGALLIAPSEEDLLVSRNESMGDDVLDSEDVPERIRDSFAVVAVRVDERDSAELSVRELVPERAYRVREPAAELEQRCDALLVGVTLFQLCLHCLVELRPLLIHCASLPALFSEHIIPQSATICNMPPVQNRLIFGGIVVLSKAM